MSAPVPGRHRRKTMPSDVALMITAIPRLAAASDPPPMVASASINSLGMTTVKS